MAVISFTTSPIRSAAWDNWPMRAAKPPGLRRGARLPSGNYSSRIITHVNIAGSKYSIQTHVVDIIIYKVFNYRENDTGLTLNVTVNGDGNGVKDLYEGKVVVAMIAAPIKTTEAILNKANPGSVNVDGFEVAPVGAIGIKFIVNAANPVKSLSEGQLKDIFTGKITSWKDVGGADQPILVVAEAPGFGTRSNIVASLLGGTEITDKARIMQALVQVGQVVAQAPNAIGYGNAATITAAAAVIPGTEVKQLLGMATKGAPNADAKKLIEAAAKYGAAVK